MVVGLGESPSLLPEYPVLEVSFYDVIKFLVQCTLHDISKVVKFRLRGF